MAHPRDPLQHVPHEPQRLRPRLLRPPPHAHHVSPAEQRRQLGRRAHFGRTSTEPELKVLKVVSCP